MTRRVKSFSRYLKTLLFRPRRQGDGSKASRDAAFVRASETIMPTTDTDNLKQGHTATHVGLSEAPEELAMSDTQPDAQGPEPDWKTTEVSNEFTTPASKNLPKTEPDIKTASPSKPVQNSAWEIFQQSGGRIDSPPNNVGHLSVVYDSLRPKFVEMVMPQFLWPQNPPHLQINRTHWQGCALQWGSGKVDPQTSLYTDVALHIGGKSVNQDAVGMCEGVLLQKDKKHPFAIIALADGVTTSLYSEFGALVAVTAALRSSIHFLAAGHCYGSFPLPMPEREAFSACLCRDFPQIRGSMKTLQQHATDSLLSFTETYSGKTPSRAVDEAKQHLRRLQAQECEHLSTTLIAACATPNWFTVAGFGNGMVWGVFSSGDIAGSWQTDPRDGLENHLSTHRTPTDPSYAWTNPLDASGIVTIGAATDGIPNSNVLRKAVGALGVEAAAPELLEYIIQWQLKHCAQDAVDNATLARIGLRHLGLEAK